MKAQQPTPIQILRYYLEKRKTIIKVENEEEARCLLNELSFDPKKRILRQLNYPQAFIFSERLSSGYTCTFWAEHDPRAVTISLEELLNVKNSLTAFLETQNILDSINNEINNPGGV